MVEPCWTLAQGALQLAESELNTCTLELKASAAGSKKHGHWNGAVAKPCLAGEHWNSWLSMDVDHPNLNVVPYRRFYRRYPKPIHKFGWTPQQVRLGYILGHYDQLLRKWGNLCAAKKTLRELAIPLDVSGDERGWGCACWVRVPDLYFGCQECCCYILVILIFNRSELSAFSPCELSDETWW